MKPKPIRAFARGLAVLAALNRVGSASALTVATSTGVPRATVYRLLQTLVEEGYVGRGAADDQFHLRLKVRVLADGFEDEQWVTSVAAPALLALTERISWPCDLSTPDGTAMVIRETTHPVAPLSIDRNMVGQRLPMFASAAGLAYLSFVPSPDRAALLDLLSRSDDPNDALARDPSQVSQLVAATRRRGYGLRQAGQIWPHTGAIALPVRVERRIIGCVGAIWMARVVTSREGVARCLEPLRETRARIEQELTRRKPA